MIEVALVPPVVLIAIFVLALPVFGVRCVLYGIPRDAETEKRGASILVGYFLRHYFFWLIRPLFSMVLGSGIPAAALTALSVLLGAFAAVAVAGDHFALGGWLFLFAGILDAMDGRIARARNSVTPAGAAMDSILDRYTDSFVLIGLAWYYRHTWVLLPILAALLGSSLVPYVRARGEGLGISVKTGLMQRLERVLILGGALALSPIFDAWVMPAPQRAQHWLTAVSLVVLSITSNATAIARFATLMRALGCRAAYLPRFVLSRYSASLIATGLDFAIVVGLMERTEVPLLFAMVLGSASGSVVEWGLRWAMSILVPRRKATKLPPINRFLLVTSMKMALNIAGVALLSLFPLLDFRLAWCLTRVAVWLAWTFPLHKYLFFSPDAVATARSVSPGK